MPATSLLSEYYEVRESSSSDNEGDEEEEMPAEDPQPTSTCMRQLGPQQVTRVIRGMQHAVDCRLRGDLCQFDLCWKMKYVIHHTRLCEKRHHQECAVCNQVVAIIVFHGIRCEEPRCRVPFCPNVKEAVVDYPPNVHYYLTHLDDLTNKVIIKLRQLPPEQEQREYGEGENEPPGLLATHECLDLVALYEDEDDE